MKTTYYRRTSNPLIAVIDLSPYEKMNGYMITRINVPESERGRGIASGLLKEVLADADKEGVPLYLGIAPSGGLNEKQLRAWYERNGFKGKNVLERLPVKSEEKDHLNERS